MLFLTIDGRETTQPEPTLAELMEEQAKAWTRLSNARAAQYKSRRGFYATKKIGERTKIHHTWMEVERELEEAEQAYKDVYNALYAFEPHKSATLD